MIELNLLPEELRISKIVKKDANNVPIESIIKYLGIFTFGLILISLILSSLFSVIISGLEGKVASLEPARIAAEKTKNELSDMKAKINSINELTVNRRSWAVLLDGISDCIPSNIWLFNISFEKRLENDVLIIEGMALGRSEQGTTSVGKLIDSMKNNAHMGNILRISNLTPYVRQ